MKSVEIEKLVGAYATVAFQGVEETVRVLGVREPTVERIGFGHTSKEVDVRRFLLGGYVDTWVLPRDVLRPADPSPSVLAAIGHVENEVGPKPTRSVVA